MFHYGSISLIVEPCRTAHLKAMKEAKAAGALLSYDPNLRLPLWPSAEKAREQIMSIWDQADVIKVSDNELEFLTESDKIDDATAMSLWHPNLKLLLVTLGDHGCRYYTKVTASLCFSSPNPFNPRLFDLQLGFVRWQSIVRLIFQGNPCFIINEVHNYFPLSP